jgi:hypothetical protein
VGRACANGFDLRRSRALRVPRPATDGFPGPSWTDNSMSIKKRLLEIRQLVDSFPEQKNDKDRLFLIAKIRLRLDCIEEPIKKRRDKKKLAYERKTRIIKKALKQLLVGFDKIYAKHEEVGDSACRDAMYAAIYRGFIQPQRGYTLPATFGMFSDTGNKLVRTAIDQFLRHPEVQAASKALKSPEDRFAAFQDDDVETSEGTSCFEYFGYSNRVREP